MLMSRGPVWASPFYSHYSVNDDDVDYMLTICIFNA